jgi:hypothetical protein
MANDKVKSRDYSFEDGYTYRVYDGTDTILIVASPKGGAGTLVTKSKNTKAWTAIMAQIAAKKSGNRQAALQASAQVAAVLVATLTPKQRRARTMPDLPPDLPPEPPAAFPWLPAGIAVGVVALIAILRSR